MQPVPSPATQDGSVSVRFLPAVLESVRSAADGGLKSLPRRGAEIGGILISSGNDPAATVDEVALIPSEYRYGPGYHLSPRDLAALKTCAADVRERKRHQVVGFFRTCTSEQFHFSPNDLDVLREVPLDCRVLLIVKPFADGHSIARVFQLLDGTWHQTSEFPITPPRMPARPKLRTVSKALVALPPPPVSRAKKWPRIPVLWIYSVLGCLVLVAAVALLGPRSSDNVALGLNVSPEGDLLRVTWNRNAAAIRSGTGGVLRIDEGAQRRDIGLDPAQLASGMVMYRSDSRDITFHLSVSGKTHTEEMIRFVTGGTVSPGVRATPNMSAPPVVPTETAKAPARVTPLSAIERTTTPTTSAPPVVPTETAKAPVRVTPLATIERADVQPTKKPEQRVSRVVAQSAPQPPPDRPAAEPTVPFKPADTSLKHEEAPQSTASQTTAPQTTAPQTTAPQTTASQTAKPPDQVAAAPASAQPASAPLVAENKPWEPIKSVMHYFNDPTATRPTPVREVRPKPKGDMPSQPVQIRVLVAVDDHGGVAGAEALNPPANAGEDLINEAIAAARHWKFEPARERGKKVPGTYTITFRFPPDNR